MQVAKNRINGENFKQKNYNLLYLKTCNWNKIYIETRTWRSKNSVLYLFFRIDSMQQSRVLWACACLLSGSVLAGLSKEDWNRKGKEQVVQILAKSEDDKNENYKTMNQKTVENRSRQHKCRVALLRGEYKKRVLASWSVKSYCNGWSKQSPNRHCILGWAEFLWRSILLIASDKQTIEAATLAWI